ncbi:pimeloyl-ACP methyl ester carboxylesterase [Pseudonocardia sediminis]|uniref:Pimeloyl-ACP methyl ester carboxylesterase n=1 Tax=Pseudonocardia sediminis TaxID=1397368 RepID=A0A4Q7UUJ4_PSEST|nr:alpha/beta hydrolase [Pseudonocardia sediminis]RZT83703.1 pimeloyl-ACP methyl ester carboxylesterase [Pseudonocardia sediminis]
MATVDVDGAELYVETVGEGPPLLIVQGGMGDAGASAQLATELARTHRVITYDRRGIARSGAGDGVVTMDRHADDAAAVLGATADGLAAVVGVSIGALLGLHLVCRHPDVVSVLVAHEPPMTALVRDDDAAAALDRAAELARDDVWAAIRHMAEFTGAGDTAEPGYRPAPPAGDPEAGLRRFFDHDFPAVRTSDIGVDRIAASAVPVVPTGGVQSRGRWEYRCAEALARGLGRDLVELPGGHDGPVAHPAAAAAALRTLVRSE